ncbi:MAG: hypothetical protein GY781_19170, partial [Gammaproteobacteria bacterium]|nr:hypothetical protein [Gammaproteobacteria bacterium]
MEELEITAKLNMLDGRGSSDEYDAVKNLSSLGDRFPELLFQKYQNSKKWGERASCVYHAIKYSRSNNSAFELGLRATKDKSKHVRYRACMLLAVAQNPSAICSLESLLADTDSSEDAKAAIDAIKHKNHHYFADRDHSGRI